MYILYHPRITPSEEVSAIESVFKSRSFFWTSALPRGTDEKILTRYFSMPDPKNLERELVSLGLVPVQPASSTISIATAEWYQDISDHYPTPKTWFGDYSSIPANGKYVVKGATNSKKFLWKTHMYAEGKSGVLKVVQRLLDDTLISEQEKIVREFWEIDDFGIGHKDLNGCPVGDEWRTIWLNGKLVGAGYYWTNHLEYLCEALPNQKTYLTKEFEEIPEGALELAEDVMHRLNHPFVCIDVAKSKKKNWFVVEVNDGTMSGIPNCNILEFYQRIKDTTVNKKNKVHTYL